MSKTTALLFRVGFMCQACQQVFKSVEKYCSHKFEFHSSQLAKSSCILFEGLTVDPKESGIQLVNFGKLLLPHDDDDPKIINNELNDQDQVVVDVKSELLEEDPVIINDSVRLQELPSSAGPASKDSSEIKTECIEEDDLSVISTDAADADLNDVQLQDRRSNDPQKKFDVTQSTPSASKRTTETKTMECVNKNNNESDEDIICLDDPLPLPSTANKVPSSAGPTRATKSKLNSIILTQIQLQCKKCSKKFRSSGQLKIHAARCQLQSSKQKTKTSAEPHSTPVVIADRISRGRRRDPLIKCEECKRLIKRPYFKRHVKSHQTLNPGESPAGFVCEICGSAFTKQCYLDVHARVHSFATPFRCKFPNCDAAFKFKSNIYRHLKTHTEFGEIQD